MNNIKFSINNYADLLKSEQEKKQIIEQAEIEFIKAYNIATIAVCKDLINNHIINKLKRLIEQASNSSFSELLKDKKNKRTSFNEAINQLRDEKESILGILTSNFKQKKRVEKVRKASGDSIQNETYLAYYSSDYSEIITNEYDIELAKRYIEIENQISIEFDNHNNEISDLESKISKLEIEEYDFSKELEILNSFLRNDNRFSNFSNYSLNSLDPEKYYLLPGNEFDYNQYKESLKTIQELNKKVIELGIY